MKKFLVTISAYFLVLGMIISAINGLYMVMDTSDSHDVAHYKTMPDEIQICNLGSSHGRHSFEYSNLRGVPTFNFAFTAQSLSYDYRLLTHYQDHLAQGCIVFIPVSYFSFFGKSETELEDFASKNERYYHILPKGLIKNYDVMTYLFTVQFPAVGAGTDAVKVLLGKMNNRQEDISLRTADMIDVEYDAYSAYQRHFVTNKRNEDGSLILMKEEVQALRDIIGLCKTIGAIPVLVTTPLLSEYTDQVLKNEPEFLPKFYEIVDQVVSETGAAYYDYAFDSRFQNAYSLFMNADHLNKTGAMLFTDIILEDIRE